jgi:hypothetical protein
MKTILSILLIVFSISGALCQDDKKHSPRLDDPYLVDTTSTMFFPIRGNDGPKISTFGDHISNIVVYDFTKDTYMRLFNQECYIKQTLLFPSAAYYNPTRKRGINPTLVFYIVKQSDTNANGRIDERDASVLYVTDARGENLRALTTNDVNVISLSFYEKLGFALVEIQRDSDGDKSFKFEDKGFYFQKISLNDLSLGKPIETGTKP